MGKIVTKIFPGDSFPLDGDFCRYKIKKKINIIITVSESLAHMDTDVESENEDGEDDEEEESVDDDGFPVGSHASELEMLRVSGHLEHQPRRQQYEQQQSDQYGRPIPHFDLPSFCYCINIS
ncbi:hypothetical protein LINGRAHAP2_LOCUS3593 [Linum grandiflorum]